MALAHEVPTESFLPEMQDVLLDTRGGFDICEERRTTRIGGEKIKLTYRAPVNEDDISDPVAVALAHGWGGTEEAYAGLGVELARLGKPNITFGDGRTLGLLQDLNLFNLMQVAKLSSKAAWGAMRYTQEEFGHDLFDIYGHSLGGQTAVNVANHKPERVRAVVLDGSCGLDFHTLGEMIERTKEFGGKELRPNLGRLALSSHPRLGPQLIHYIFRNPGRTLAEGLNAGSVNLHKRIERLAALGIGAAAIQSPKDLFFPVEAVESHSRHLFGEHFYTREDPEANHIAPQLDPSGTAEAILRAIHALNAARRPRLAPAA